MPRFTPFKPQLAVVPVKDDSGRIVDAAMVAVVPESPEPRDEPRRKSKRSFHRRAARPAARKFSVLTLTENEARNGLQLFFPGKPSEEIRAELKAAGWRWSFFNGCWYHRNTPENKIWAVAFTARHMAPSVAAPVATTIHPVGGAPLPVESKIIPFPQSAPAIPAWRRRLTA